MVLLSTLKPGKLQETNPALHGVGFFFIESRIVDSYVNLCVNLF